jgi:FdhD protein
MPRLSSDGRHDARELAEECPVALVYDGTTAAVLMATPADLTDLALGFSLTEGIIGDIGEIGELTVVPGPDGIELRLWLRPNAGRRLKERRRHLVGPTGCGLCGIDSLREAGRTARCRRAAGEPHDGADQHGHRGAHGSADPQPSLDKLAGALAKEGRTGRAGAVILTSRISVEMVQKTAAIGAGVVVAMSALTALAVRTAEASGITLVGIARGSEFEIFSHPARVVLPSGSSVSRGLTAR